LVKRFISVTLQMLLFLVAFGAGSFLPGVNALPMWRVQASATHFFVLDGVFLMLVLFVLILGIEAARRRLGHSAGLSVLALVLALALGLAMKFPLMSR
jgi:Tfp pilus assembly protein PilN